MLDDIQLFYYDSNVGKTIHGDVGLMWTCSLFQLITISFIFTKGIHVQQRIAGCELLDNGTAGPVRTWDAFNGVNDGELQYSTGQKTLQAKGEWSATWRYYGRKQLERMFANIYHPICIKILKNYLHTRKNHVMRKVKPRVRLLQKTLPDSGVARVTCLATGFYPRHINLTLLRDGQPVPDHQITGGELLPNGDGTYQMRISLEVSTEELQQHPYTCTAEHLSLDNKLDFGLGKYLQLILIFSALDNNVTDCNSTRTGP
ncbi:hypothetical protein ACEWY4_004298 [Coilia grayii]|uniref:Ig-like domain-containing protein n=1 Tax=Coilia grayii TaxID=363190 RepID=A0ABD1KLC3_9TELE